MIQYKPTAGMGRRQGSGKKWEVQKNVFSLELREHFQKGRVSGHLLGTEV